MLKNKKKFRRAKGFHRALHKEVILAAFKHKANNGYLLEKEPKISNWTLLETSVVHLIVKTANDSVTQPYFLLFSGSL